MMLAYQLVVSPTPQTTQKFSELSQSDQAWVQEYIHNQGQLPLETQSLIEKSQAEGSEPIDGPTYESSGGI